VIEARAANGRKVSPDSARENDEGRPRCARVRPSYSLSPAAPEVIVVPRGARHDYRDWAGLTEPGLDVDELFRSYMQCR
jgi:hypothetical protein